jgi:hypothetical protein
VEEGIGVFLTPDLARGDLWEQAETGLSRFLREHPDLEAGLMEVEPDALAPADRFFRSMVHEERGEAELAQLLRASAVQELYTPEYRACYQNEIEYLVVKAASFTCPIVDLASGQGALVEALLQRVINPVVMTDFSPTILRRNRRGLRRRGLERRVSLLAVDARRTPFRAGAIELLTSNLALGNVDGAHDLLTELRRIVGGTLLSVSYFFPDDDAVHGERLTGKNPFFRSAAVAAMESTGWTVSVENTCYGRAEPTPEGQVLRGFGIDELPLVATRLEWCVLVAQ